MNGHPRFAAATGPGPLEMPKKGRGKGKGKGKKKGKKGPKVPEPEPELAPALRNAPPPSLRTSVLPLSCRCGAFLAFEAEGYLVLAHAHNGTWIAVESGEPYSQYAYRSPHSSGCDRALSQSESSYVRWCGLEDHCANSRSYCFIIAVMRARH